MQHVVNIAFDFDDERVKKILEETTVDKIQKDIREIIIDQLFEKRWSNKHANPASDHLQEWVKWCVKDFIVEYKDDIVKQAAKEVAEKLARSNTFREKVIKEVSE